ncbi:MAG: hypothetical protein ACYS4W_00845 [Planctomycetota bacterium]|jgi:hypothetical protein
MRESRHTTLLFRFFVSVFVPAVLFGNGCGFISLLGTPTRHERKVAAEYDLTENRDGRLLVLVRQPSWLNAQVNLRYHVTARMNEELTEKIELENGNLVSYRELSDFRSRRPDFAFRSATEVGAALGADMVLYVTINGHELNRLDEVGYYKGFLSAECALHDVTAGKRVWPVSGESKSVMVGFDLESGGVEVAVQRLAASLAYCTVRYFYDCPEEQFRISEDKSDISWQRWRKERVSGDSQ